MDDIFLTSASGRRACVVGPLPPVCFLDGFRPLHPVKRNLVLVYWLLLLVSTLAIGGLAFYLLQGESNRLRKLASDEAEHTGQVIATSLNVNVAGTKTRAMEQLSQLPDKDLERQLVTWKNPFTDLVFLYRPMEGLIMPRNHTKEFKAIDPLLHTDKGWVWGEPDYNQMRLANASRPNFSPNGLPGQPVPANPLASKPASNAAIQNASNMVVINGPLNGPDNSVGSMTIALSQTPGGAQVELPAAAQSEQTPNSAAAILKNLPTDNTITIQIQRQGLVYETVNVLNPNPTQLAELARPDSGWVPVGPEKDRRWLGWVRTYLAGPVRGMVLDWDREALQKALQESFPAKTDFAAGFVLLNPAGTPVYWKYPDSNPLADSVNGGPSADPSTKPNFKQILKLPVGAEMPGWNLAVYFNPTANFSSGYIGVSTVMVTILIIAVLVGGTLLLREARREASEAARKTSFVSNVSHELKTPLTTIRMYAELLGEGRVRDEGKQRNYLSTIIGESQRLTRLVNNVLDFSRLEQGRKQYHPTDVALPPIIDAVLNAQKPRLDEAGFAVGVSFPGGPAVRVHADRDALEQVLLNLIDNAMKYAATGRWIGIRLSTDTHFAYVAVSDRGPGVPSDHQEKIFDTFHRVDDSITASQPGAGLGLSIARRLLRDQEGDLIYQDHQPNGSTFVAKVPLASALSAAKIA